MSNFTMPPVRRYVRECRPYDFKYDPCYTFPNHSDYPNQQNNGCYNSRTLSTSEPRSCSTLPTAELELHKILGTDRHLYFMGYREPFQSNAAVFLAETPRKTTGTKCANVSANIVSGSKTRGTQTMFRETEAQTDPYTPPFKFDRKTYPKVLALVKFTWGQGLPATLDDIVAIEQALTQRFLRLNANKNAKELESLVEKSVKQSQEMELEQWKNRERMLDNIRKLKFAALQRQLDKMYQNMSSKSRARLEEVTKRLREERDVKLNRIKADYIRGLRKLERKYSTAAAHKSAKRDIILDYIDSQSSIYAPLARNGLSKEQMAKAPAYQFTAHLDYETISQLSQSKSFIRNHIDFEFNGFATCVDSIKPSRAAQRLAKKLKDCYQAFEEAKIPKEALEPSLTFKNRQRSSTPPPPEASMPVSKDEEAVILLQSLMRGHEVQSMMRQEAHENMDAILRLKALWEADPFAVRQTINEKLGILSEQEHRLAVEQEGAPVESLAQQLEGEILFQLMDFLEKEMTRLMDERKVHCLMLMAERERRMREAAEAGRRQRNQEDTRLNEEVWRQVLGVHQQTVDMYLEDMYLEASNRTADDEARQHVHKLARSVNDAAYLMESNIQNQNHEELASDLVHSFLIPNAVRQDHEDRITSMHGRYYTSATQVTDALLSSQGMSNLLMEFVQAHLQSATLKGNMTVEASKSAVEDLICEAITKVLFEASKAQQPATVDMETSAQHPPSQVFSSSVMSVKTSESANLFESSNTKDINDDLTDQDEEEDPEELEFAEQDEEYPGEGSEAVEFAEPTEEDTEEEVEEDVHRVTVKFSNLPEDFKDAKGAEDTADTGTGQIQRRSSKESTQEPSGQVSTSVLSKQTSSFSSTTNTSVTASIPTVRTKPSSVKLQPTSSTSIVEDPEELEMDSPESASIAASVIHSTNLVSEEETLDNTLDDISDEGSEDDDVDLEDSKDDCQTNKLRATLHENKCDEEEAIKIMQSALQPICVPENLGTMIGLIAEEGSNQSDVVDAILENSTRVVEEIFETVQESFIVSSDDEPDVELNDDEVTL